MADIEVTGEFNSRKIEAGMKRVTEGSKRMSKAGKNNSLALLEASRAIEDYSVAGMRGALNNIPGLIMNLGAGAGVAGAASLAAVGMMGAVKALEAWMDKSRQARNADAMKSFGAFRTEALITERELNKAIKEGEELFKSKQNESSDRVSIENAASDQKSRSEEARISVLNAEELLRLEKEGASSGKIKMAQLRQQNEALKRRHELEGETLVTAEAELQNLRIRKDLQEKAVAKGEEARKRAEDQRKLELAAIAYDAKLQREAGGKYRPQDSQEIAEKARKESGMTPAKLNQIKEDVRLGEIAASRVKLLDDEIRKAETLVNIEKRRTKAATDELEAQARITKIEAEKIRMEEERRRQDLFVKSMQEKINTEGFLSSRGQVGMSGAEAQSAMDAINIQRNMLTELKKITRNTGKARVATYG